MTTDQRAKQMPRIGRRTDAPPGRPVRCPRKPKEKKK